MRLIITKGKRSEIYRKAKPGAVAVKLHRSLSRLWDASVWKFIEAAVERIIIDTGMSAASLVPLAARIRKKSLLMQSLRGMGVKRPGHKAKHLPGGWADNAGPYKSKALGERLGSKAYVITYGTPFRPVFKLSFKIPVYQYYLHEHLDNYQGSGHWDSLAHGERALRAHWENGIYAMFVNESLDPWVLSGGVS